MLWKLNITQDILYNPWYKKTIISSSIKTAHLRTSLIDVNIKQNYLCLVTFHTDFRNN